MRLLSLALAGVLNFSSLQLVAQELPAKAAVVQSLTLAEAWHLAETANPTLRAKQAQLSAAQASSADAAAPLNDNPELSVETTRRSAPRADLDRERFTEWKLGVSQAVEIAGQPTFRRRAADAALESLNAEIEDVRRQLRVDIAQDFYRVLGLQDRIRIEQEASTLFDSTAAAVEKRRAAGEDTRLDANFAAVEAERARSQIGILAEQLTGARGELATRLQLPPDRVPAASGTVTDLVSPARFTRDRLLSNVDVHPRMRAHVAKEESARARLALERARRYPDVTFGLSIGREGPGDEREHLTTVSVSVPLPLFKRNAAAIGQATSELTQAEIERQSTSRNLRGEIYVLLARMDSLEERVQRLRTRVMPRLEDNVTLARKSRDAGQIGLLEMIVVNRQALEAQRELIEAATEYHTTRLALELAAGLDIKELKP